MTAHLSKSALARRARKRFVVDLVERVVATYVETFVGLLMVSGVTNLSTARTAAVAALPTALAVVKGAAAKFVGSRDSASLADVAAP